MAVCRELFTSISTALCDTRNESVNDAHDIYFHTLPASGIFLQLGVGNYPPHYRGDVCIRY